MLFKLYRNDSRYITNILFAQKYGNGNASGSVDSVRNDRGVSRSNRKQ